MKDFNNEYLVKMNRLMQRNLSTFALHQKTFPQFKTINWGKEVVIVASGTTASKYKQIKDAVHIGVNSSFKLGIPLDYIFIQDYSGRTPEYIDELDNYPCQKFYGLTNEFENDPERTIPEFHAIKASALRYRTDWDIICKDGGFVPEFTYDLSTKPLCCHGSIIFPALQFALWTHPKRIYLVGCDCNNNGYAWDKNYKNTLPVDYILKGYKKFIEFKNKYYPEVEVVSINPIGLKGYFKDIYI